MNLNFIPVKTRIVRPPKDNILDIIDSLEIKNGDIVFITSKILGISEGRTAKITETTKEELIKIHSLVVPQWGILNSSGQRFVSSAH